MTISDHHQILRANCTSGLCCRRGNPVTSLQSNYTPSVPAPRFGYFACDTPWALGAAAVEAIPVLTGTDGEDSLNMTLFTGDLVSHDPYNQLSRDYIQYTETGELKYFSVSFQYYAINALMTFQLCSIYGKEP